MFRLTARRTLWFSRSRLDALRIHFAGYDYDCGIAFMCVSGATRYSNVEINGYCFMMVVTAFPNTTFVNGTLYDLNLRQ